MSQKSKNDIAWEKLFEQYSILEEIHKSGVFRISASQINQFREARLMTKFDHYINLPRIFRDNNLCILPDSRGTYLIGYFEAYEKILSNFSLPPLEFPFPTHIETIDHKNLYSEVSALLCAYNSGIIADLLGEPVSLTVLGRMSTSKFSYQIKNQNKDASYIVEVDSAQCEIDAGFEGETKFALVEAKNYSVEDFLIRQLYYPYRLWCAKTFKQVIPIFMTYSNDVFTFWVYKFQNDVEYNSLELVAKKTYQIAPERIELNDIFEIFQSAQVEKEPDGVPFPQANEFRRAIDLLGLLYVNDLSQSDITLKYEFDVRQTQYYTGALVYLDLVQRYKNDSNIVCYSLSDTGRAILEKPPKKKYLAIAEKILQHKVFYEAIAQYFSRGERPPRVDVIKIMQNANLNLDTKNSTKKTTISRRAQTVQAWIDWILRLPHSE